MSELYREEENFWVYKNNYPFGRKATAREAASYIEEQRVQHPTATFKIVRETHSVEEVRSFAPLQKPEKYRV
jgi:hypothetical protein